MFESGKTKHSMFNMLRNVKYDLKQNMVISCPPPSLQYLSLSKIAISLWKSHLKYCDSKHKIIWCLRDILGLISNLPIPEPCKETLKSILKSTGNEIGNNFLLKRLVAYKKFKVYLDNICWNQEGTFNVLKTVIKIIDESNLSTLEKYELACDFCLKEKIRNLQKNLSENDIKTLEDKEANSLSAFWSLYIKEKKLPTLIKGVEASEYLFNCLDSDSPQSEVAVQFIWENFADEKWKEEVEDITPSILCWDETHLDNIALYIFKQMNQDQLKETGICFHFKVLEKLHIISKWSNVLPIREYALDFIKTRKNMLKGFEIIKYCWLERPFLNLEDLINLWNEFVHQYNFDLGKKIIKYYNIFMQNDYGYAYKQGIMAQLLLGVANSEDRKKMIYCRKTMEYCQNLLCKKDLQSLDLFLNQMLKKNISHFKRKFFKVRRFNICTELILRENYELLDKILNKFCTDETVREFKEIYCIDILDSVLKMGKKIIRDPTYVVYLLKSIWKFLSWRFDGCKKEMARYRALVFDLDSVLYKDIRENFFYILKIFIKRGLWILVRKYWKWIFTANKKNATKPMEKLALGKKIFIATYGKEDSLSFLKKKNCHGLIKKFITSCFKKDEVKKLKKQLQHGNDLSLLVKELIELENLPEVKDLLKWSFSSSKSKIASFKITFMDVFGCSLLFHSIRHDNIIKAKSLLTWFNPSYEFAEMFEKRFMSYIENKKKLDIVGEENQWKRLNERIFESLEFLKSFAKEKSVLDKEHKDTEGQDSKKRKIAEEEEPFESCKKKKISN